MIKLNIIYCFKVFFYYIFIKSGIIYDIIQWLNPCIKIILIKHFFKFYS